MIIIFVGISKMYNTREVINNGILERCKRFGEYLFAFFRIFGQEGAVRNQDIKKSCPNKRLAYYHIGHT